VVAVIAICAGLQLVWSGRGPRDRAPGKHSHIDRQDTQRSTGGAFLTRSKTGLVCRKYLENKMKNAVQMAIAIPLKQSFAPVIFCRVASPDSVVALLAFPLRSCGLRPRSNCPRKPIECGHGCIYSKSGSQKMSSRKVVSSNLSKLFRLWPFCDLSWRTPCIIGTRTSRGHALGFRNRCFRRGHCRGRGQSHESRNRRRAFLVTDEAGRFNAPSLVVGRYELRRPSQGFAWTQGPR